MNKWDLFVDGMFVGEVCEGEEMKRLEKLFDEMVKEGWEFNWRGVWKGDVEIYVVLKEEEEKEKKVYVEEKKGRFVERKKR